MEGNYFRFSDIRVSHIEITLEEPKFGKIPVQKGKFKKTFTETDSSEKALCLPPDFEFTVSGILEFFMYFRTQIIKMMGRKFVSVIPEDAPPEGIVYVFYPESAGYLTPPLMNPQLDDDGYVSIITLLQFTAFPRYFMERAVGGAMKAINDILYQGDVAFEHMVYGELFMKYSPIQSYEGLSRVMKVILSSVPKHDFIKKMKYEREFTSNNRSIGSYERLRVFKDFVSEEGVDADMERMADEVYSAISVYGTATFDQIADHLKFVKCSFNCIKNILEKSIRVRRTMIEGQMFYSLSTESCIYDGEGDELNYISDFEHPIIEAPVCEICSKSCEDLGARVVRHYTSDFHYIEVVFGFNSAIALVIDDDYKLAQNKCMTALHHPNGCSLVACEMYMDDPYTVYKDNKDFPSSKFKSTFKATVRSRKSRKNLLLLIARSYDEDRYEDHFNSIRRKSSIYEPGKYFVDDGHGAFRSYFSTSQYMRKLLALTVIRKRGIKNRIRTNELALRQALDKGLHYSFAHFNCGVLGDPDISPEILVHGFGNYFDRALSIARSFDNTFIGACWLHQHVKGRSQYISLKKAVELVTASKCDDLDLYVANMVVGSIHGNGDHPYVEYWESPETPYSKMFYAWVYMTVSYNDARLMEPRHMPCTLTNLLNFIHFEMDGSWSFDKSAFKQFYTTKFLQIVRVFPMMAKFATRGGLLDIFSF